MKKRILLVTQYFYPENFKSNDLAFEMSARGYKVHVLTEYLIILPESITKDILYLNVEKK